MSQAVTARDLTEFELFKDLGIAVTREIAPYFHKQHYRRGDMIYSSQDSARHFLFVREGTVKIFRLSRQGKEQIIRLILPHEFTGELALFEGVRKAYAVALSACEIYTVTHDDFKQILASYPELALKMIEILAMRLHLSEEQTSLLSTNTTKERLWIYLNDESEIVDGSRRVYYKQTKRFMAAYLGMTSETLSRALHQLEQEGKIKEYPDHYIELITRE